MTTTVDTFTHHAFGLVDEHGRQVGLLSWTTTVSRRWDREANGFVDCEPMVYIRTHAARDGVQYGASNRDVPIGAASDPATVGKAKAEIDRRVAEARKRYERKYGKGAG